MTQTTNFPERPQVELNHFTKWFPAAVAEEVSARTSDTNALIDYLSTVNDLTRSETVEMLDILQLDEIQSDDTTALRAA